MGSGRGKVTELKQEEAKHEGAVPTGAKPEMGMLISDAP